MNIFRFYCLCTFIALCNWGGVASAQVVEIPDPNLERAIREELELSSELPITQQDMLKLFSFSAQDAQIENLTGIKYAHNLESLHIPGNPIQDLSPIANLTQLRFLNLAGISIKDLTFLSNLTQLQKITLVSCQIRDITPLANLTQLILLNIRDNWIVDISPLANLTRLEKLWIDSNSIVDVSPLANLTRLTDLTIASNTITDFRPLFGLNLQSVDIDIHKLQELASSEIEIPDPNLRQAIREALALPDEIPITQLEMLRLTGFAAEVAQVEDLTGLEYAHNLKRLYLRNNPIKDLTPIANLTQLELLHLAGVPIQDLSPIQDLKELRELHLSHCGIIEITPLANLTRLNFLNLGANQIVDISPLSNLTMLETLWLQRNQITDISPLANLTALKRLRINNNQIVDFSPIQGLSLSDLKYDEVCVLPRSPIQDRIDNRNLPSVILPWDDGILNRGGNWWDDSIPYLDRVAYHDLWWHYTPFGLRFLLTPQGYQLMGDLQSAIDQREELLSKNPDMLFLVDLRQSYASRSRYPDDWFGWLRDENGNFIPQKPGSTEYLIDFRLPEVQAVVVQRAIAVAKCGLYDGIMFDAWAETHAVLPNSTLQEEQPVLISILRRIRQGVPDDFLILCNRNETKLPLSAPYINGGFMETFPLEKGRLHGYTRKDIIEIETNLIWYEANMREPKINVLRGFGVGAEPPDSPRNKQWMRLFTTMSLTLSDGYALYTLGTIGGQKQYQKHIWHPFWDADLGQPIGQTAQRYQDIEGLYIREFDNGWAVYNRSGNVQEISLPENATGVASGQTGKAHQLPDLDGEIYLKTVAGQPTSPYDLNMDGVVNVLDLILTAQNLGSTEGDINGDGITNILDLILVAQHLGETSTPAAPAALPTSLSPETVQKWIDMAYAQNDGSVIFAQGIAMLERLLALMIPDKTVLRANYPNPFNPETWIPYHLASNTEVRISIYDIQGVLVRQFNLGYQKAGYYTNRTKAAHWDGRNEIGESVS